jgi:hypothetical protein
MFVMYQDGNGNVTLSTRAGRGHVMPQFSDMPGVELLAGSGVQDGKMVANVRCSQCDNLDLSGQSSWIAAWLEGDALDSDSTSAPISQHDDETGFTVDLSQASIASDANPFVESAPSSGGNENGSTGGQADSGGAVEESSGDSEDLPRIHGVIMSVVFVIGYPLGAMLMPIVRIWWVHSTFQVLVFLLMWAGFGIGYVQANRDGSVSLPPQQRRCDVTRGMLTSRLAVLQPSSHQNGHHSRGSDGSAACAGLDASRAVQEDEESRRLQLRPHLVRPRAHDHWHRQRRAWLGSQWCE